MTALEQSFVDVCAAHDLHCLGVNFYPSHGDAWFTVYAHSGDFLGSASGPTIAVALGGAIEVLAARRAASVPLADEALPVAA